MLKYIHPLAYAALAAGYAGTCVGADKLIVSAVIAALYLVLAAEEFHRRHGDGE